MNEWVASLNELANGLLGINDTVFWGFCVCEIFVDFFLLNKNKFNLKKK